MPSSPRLAALAALALALLLPSAAAALTIDVSFTASTYQVQAGDRYADLLAEHTSGVVLGASSVTSLAGVSTSVYAPGNTTDYSVLMSVQLVAAQSGSYQFQAGVDWGRGGVAAVLDNGTGATVSELVRTDDIWWAYDWNHSDVFVTGANLTAGESYTLAWIGFEGCCAGSSTIRFSYEGSPFTVLDTGSMGPYAAVRAPGAAALLGAALVALPLLRRRR
ncbi:MAG: hypothetical protein HKP30_12975 [Myxococcales bacterium]|nr:hypothetical protein [Myxococcales bacterium]